jgi:hypothetical protein
MSTFLYVSMSHEMKISNNEKHLVFKSYILHLSSINFVIFQDICCIIL